MIRQPPLSVPSRLTAWALIGVLLIVLAVAGCGTSTHVLGSAPVVGLPSETPKAAQKLGFPTVATKNTTRVGGGDPTTDAAAVALAVYPSVAPGTHPPAVALAPSDRWPAALATASLMAAPFRIPLLLSGRSSAPTATTDALSALAPTGSSVLAGAPALIRIGDAAVPDGAQAQKKTQIGRPGDDGPTLAAAIDRFEAAVRGRTSRSVIIASADAPAYAMPAAGLAAESGQPILYVTAGGVPAVTRTALLAHGHPRIYVLGPSSVISDQTARQLAGLGSVKRVGAEGAEANAVAFAVYRDPACVNLQPCAHIPDSFGWALRSPGHGYSLASVHRPLDAAAAAALSATGSYGPILLVNDAASLPQPVLNYFLDYGPPAYNASGPTAAVYNHGWVIGDNSAVSVAVQAQLDKLLEVVPAPK